MNTILKTLFLTVVVMTTDCVSPRSGEAQPAKQSPASEDKSFDFGQGQLHFRVIRGAAPTIVLECGAGENATQWASLQPEIARLTGRAVVSYDRPGYGKSDLPSSPYDPVLEMRQLQQGLKRLGLDREVILVGHSYGALLNQLYASQNPKTIRGVVLVDPNTVGFIDSIGGVGELMKAVPAQLPEPIQATKRFLAGYEAAVESFRPVPFRSDLPMVVITAGKPWWPTEDWNRLYSAAHEKLVEGNPNRSRLVADGCGHNVPGDRPDVVLAAIKAVVARIDAKLPPKHD
jgi:pimeloyl-ACP methyl ester carboxylesterase